MEGSPIRVLLVDDSMAMRALLRELLSEVPGIEVVGEAGDPFEARERIKQLNPDVVTLDVEMPRMNGLQFLENLMRLRPMPVVMFSSLTARGAEVSLQALALGAVEVLQKPAGTGEDELRRSGLALERAIRAAASSRPRGMRSGSAVAPARPPDKLAPIAGGLRPASRVIAIGASTGGTEAIRELLESWALPDVALLVAQHIPAAFSGSFAERLNRMTALQVHHATDGEVLYAGHAYVAPGGLHLRLGHGALGFHVRLGEDEAVNRHRPSVDVLFDSVVPFARSCCAAVILTGMGDDGARGLLRLRNAGVHTVAQDESSSVVWGMPGSAVRLDAVDCVLPLRAIAAHLAKHAAGPQRRAANATPAQVAARSAERNA